MSGRNKIFNECSECSLDKKRQDPFANFIAGGVGGLASLLISHPFDTLKVRLQTGAPVAKGKSGKYWQYGPEFGESLPPRYRNSWHALRHMVPNKGVSSLYRGMSVVAWTSVPRFAFMFYANSWGKHVAASTCGDKVGHVEGDKEFSHHQLHHIVMGGLLSQLLVVPTFTVHIERFKTLQQVYPERFNGVWDVLRYVVSKEDGLRGLFRGTMMTLARDIPFYITYFATYEHLRHDVRGRGHKDRLTPLEVAAIGGVAGLVAWTVVLPFDNMMVRALVAMGKNKSGFAIAKDVIAEGGIRNFYRGFGVVLARTFPVNAAMFLAYEWTMRGLVLWESEKPPESGPI